MGALFSFFADIRLLISTIATSKHDFEQVRSRLEISPGVPVACPTSSSWQNPASRLCNLQSDKLPSELDIFIIGSGISGCAIAKTILEHAKGRNLRLAVVDAREICSGATGRNGGHIKETPYLDYDILKKHHGEDSAKTIIEFRMAHLERLMQVAKECGVKDDCEIRTVETVDAYFSEKVWQDAVRKLESFDNTFPANKDDYKVWAQDKARKEFSLPTVNGVITGPAGALSPYDLVTSIYSSILHSREYPNFILEANTAVIDILPPSRSSPTYTVKTTRGTISAHKIVHATNAHVSHFLPGLRAKVFPVRAQMTSLLPIPRVPNLPGGASRSWSFIYDKGFDYLTVRPSGHIMFGGGWAQSGNNGLDDIGVASDDSHSIFASSHLLGLLPAVFDPSVLRGVEVEGRWSGSIGMSADALPWVGRVPESVSRRKGAEEWVCAGFTGEGMVNAWGCGEALGKLIVGEKADELPDEMIITEARVKRANPVQLLDPL